MGIIASNYIVEDRLIDLYKNEEFDFEDYANKESLSHSYKNRHFEKPSFSFTASIKSWSPMYQLLIILDKSKNKILSQLTNENRWIEGTAMNSSVRHFYSQEVKSFWKELKTISIGDLEKAIDKPLIVERISNMEGYWNDRISRKEHIVMDFF